MRGIETESLIRSGPWGRWLLVALPLLIIACGSTAAQPGHHRIELRGEVGSEVITCKLVRTGDDTWTWTEKGTVFNFVALSDTESQLELFDKSRDMYHRLNLKSRKEVWRTGTTGEWHTHYDIVEVE